MKKEKYKILFFFDDEIGRDVEMVLPIAIYAEEYLNCEVSFAFAWDAIQVYKQKPNMVFLPNTVGSPFYYQVAKYAKESGIKVFALISEGNFRTDGTFNYWGYNLDKDFMQEYICLWSERTFNFLSKELPAFKYKMRVTGATGFDRYKIYQFETKDQFLKRYDLQNYKKVIGYAGWAFGKLYNKQGREELLYYFKNDKSRFTWLENQMHNVENILESTIKNNPDTLFLLKRHPNEANPSLVGKGQNEMINLEKYPNALYIIEGENVHDLINIADIWLGFETTTALEAWLLGNTPTLLINPDPDFIRDDLYKGSLIVKSYEQLQLLIDEYYLSDKIEAFESIELKNNREQLINDIIGFGDGLNHLRVGYLLKKSIESDHRQKQKVKLKLKYILRHIYLNLFSIVFNKKIFNYLPKLKKTIWVLDRFKLNKTKKLKVKYNTQLKNFYKINNIENKTTNNYYLEKLLNK